MVNGRTLEEELKYIEYFFNNTSQEEFDRILDECGAKVVKENCDYKCSLCKKLLKKICDKLTKTK